MLVDLKIKHHVHALTVVAEIIHVRIRQHIGFSEHNAIALPPLEKFTKHPQHIELLLGFSDVRTLGRDNERYRIHSKSRDTLLNPEAHDLEDLSLHLRMRRIQIRLKIVEP